MNADSKYTAVHMRARMEGFKFAYCGNCTEGGTGKGSRWCTKRNERPNTDIEYVNLVCDLHESIPYTDKTWEEKIATGYTDPSR